MIFVTVGTERYPFDRLLRYIDETIERCAIKEEVFYQIGSSHYRSKQGRVELFLPFTTMKEYVQKASLVITHGGVGSVNLCLSFGKKPIVCPRKKSLGEAIHNQQLRYAQFMEEKGYLFLVQNEKQLEEKMMRGLQEVNAPLPSFDSSEKDKLVNFLNSLL